MADKTTKLVRGKEIPWDYTLGGPIATVPPQEGVEGYEGTDAAVDAVAPPLAATVPPIVDDIVLSPAKPAKAAKGAPEHIGATTPLTDTK